MKLACLEPNIQIQPPSFPNINLFSFKNLINYPSHQDQFESPLTFPSFTITFERNIQTTPQAKMATSEDNKKEYISHNFVPISKAKNMKRTFESRYKSKILMC
jgi:hypothetical protein